MTSASELFYTRRSRLGRPEHHQGIDSLPPERTFHNRRHHRHDLDGCDPLRRSPHVRHISHRLPHSDRASVRPDQGSSQLVSTDANNAAISRNVSGPSLNGSERLPGAVLLARARLLERLRGVSLSENRRSARASSDVNRRVNIFGDDFRLDDVGDWGTETFTGWFIGSSPFLESTPETERQEAKKIKPPGLSQEALDCLHIEVFSGFKIDAEQQVSKVLLDCGICLESFMDGDELVCLPCEHRFHSACLYPWVRSCGDCPYCRRDIVVSSHRGI